MLRNGPDDTVFEGFGRLITAHLQIIQTCTALLGGAAPHFHDGL